MKAEDLIQKCIQGNAPKSLIKELEDEIPDPNSVRLELLSRFKASDILTEIKVDSEQIEVLVEEQLKHEAHDIIDVYSSVYPEFEFYVTLIEESFKLNTAIVSLKQARAYAEKAFSAAGKDLDDSLPNFDTNYMKLQKSLKKALNISRIQMPVIEPKDITDFETDLKKGRVDIFAPYAKGKLSTPTSFKSGGEGKEWISLGFTDGSKTDDMIKGKLTTMAASKLLPTQSEIWLENILGKIIKFGKPGSGSPVLNTTIIVSKEGYILDGHHRFGQVMLVDSSMKMKALYVPLPIKLLLKIGYTYGIAIGNTPKA